MTDEKSEEEHQHPITIIVNGRERSWDKKEISFREVVLLAFPNAVFDEKTEFTVAYTHGSDHKPKGTMVDGESIKVKDREVFNVSSTDRS